MRQISVSVLGVRVGEGKYASSLGAFRGPGLAGGAASVRFEIAGKMLRVFVTEGHGRFFYASGFRQQFHRALHPQPRQPSVRAQAKLALDVSLQGAHGNATTFRQGMHTVLRRVRPRRPVLNPLQFSVHCFPFTFSPNPNDPRHPLIPRQRLKPQQVIGAP